MLRKLGLKENWIYEVLMETGDLHRAPIGIWTEDFATFVADIYHDSSTYSNLNSTGIGSIYFIEDPKYFVNTKEAEYFARADFKVIEKLSGNPTRFVFKVLSMDIIREGTPINRAKGLFLEYLIDASRKGISEAAKKRCMYYKKVIQKVAPGSVYDNLIEKISKSDRPLEKK